MGLLDQLARAYLNNQARNRQRGYGRGGYGPYGRLGRRPPPPPPWYAPRRPPPRQGIRFFGPVPYYSRTTRGGSRVSVGGCCLPIPLGMLLAGGLGARALSRR